MQAARVTPFSFSDLGAAPDPAPAAPRVSGEEIEAARRAGYAQGAAEAREGAEVEAKATLAAIAEAIEGARADLARELEEERGALRRLAHACVTRFAERLSAARETDIALSLIDRLVAASADRSPARLELGARAHQRIGEALSAEIARRGLHDFIDVAVAADLGEGACRLAWRGGAATYERAQALKEIDEAFGLSPLVETDDALVWRPTSNPLIDALAARLAMRGAARTRETSS